MSLINARLCEIIVPDRYRRDMGDIDALAMSLDDIGLLHPIGIDSDNRLVFGERRLRAAELLGWATIPARVLDMDALQAEHDENELRKDFTVSERVAIGRALEERMGKRQGQRTDLEHTEKFPEVTGETRDAAAKVAGFGNGRTYEQAKRVAEQGAQPLVDAVDRGEVSVNAAATLAELPEQAQAEVVARGKSEILSKAKEIRTEKARHNQEERKARQIEALAIAPPQGRYRTIVIDPPWPMQKIERDVRPNQVGFDYPTMTEDELSVFDIPAADECHLYLWTTQRFMPMGLRLLDTWGFRYIFMMVWHKPGGPQPFGLPQYNCEFVLFGRKGSLDFLDTKQFSCAFNAPRREHSRKPDEFYDTVSRVSPGPRIDIFSREIRDGFDQFGNETGKFSDVVL